MAGEFRTVYEIFGDDAGLKRTLRSAKDSINRFAEDFERTIVRKIKFDNIGRALEQTIDQFQDIAKNGADAFDEVTQAAVKTAGGVGQIRRDIGNLKRDLVLFGAGVAAIGAEVRQGIKFEDAFADVRKVVDGTRNELKKLESDVKNLSTGISLPLTELTGLVAKGGQLGIPLNDLKEFAKLTAETAVGFEMIPEEAANANGKLRAIYKLTIDELRRLNDQINAVADKASGVVEERDLLNFLGRLGDLAQQFGLLRSETVALGGTLLSLGKAPETAATAMRNLFTALRTADQQNDNFRKGFRALGLDATEFAKTIDDDPKRALDSFLVSLQKLNARSRAGVIESLLGGGDDAGVLSELISNLDEFNRLTEIAGKQEIFSGSLARTFEERERTVSAALQRLSNSFQVLAINAGQLFLPAIRAAADAMRFLVVGIANFVEQFPNIATFGQITLVLLPLAGLFRLLRLGATLFFAKLAEIGGVTVQAIGFVSRFKEALVVLGRGGLALLGGWVGVAVSALTFLGFKLVELQGQTVEFAGQQTTYGEIISAGWRALTSRISEFVGGVLQSLGQAAAGLLNYLRINEQTWNAITQSLANAVVSIGQYAKDAANFLIRGFDGGRVAIATIFDGILSNIKSNLRSAVLIARAAAQDIKNAFSGDFSVSNFANAVKAANQKNFDNFSAIKDRLKKNLAEIGQTDYVGTLVKSARAGLQKAGSVIRSAVAEEIRKGQQTAQKTFATEQRKRGSGLDVSALLGEGETAASGAGGGGRRSRSNVADTARDDARQISQAQLQELRDSINQQQSLLQAQRDLELQQAGDNAEAKLAIERRYNDESLRLRQELLQAELSVKQQELAATSDRGDAAQILADIKRLEGELAAARQQSGIEAQKLALTEQKSAEDRLRTQAELRERLLQGTAIGETEAQLRAEQEVFEAFKNKILTSQEEFQQALDNVRNRFKDTAQGMSVYADQAARNMQSAFADFLFDPFKDGLDGLLLNFVNILRRMAAEAVSAQLFEAILGTQGQDGSRSGGLFGLLAGLGQSSGASGSAPGVAAQLPQAASAVASPDLFGDFFSGLGDVFSSGLDGVLSGLSSAGGGIASFFSTFGDLLSEGLESLAGLLSSDSSSGSGGGAVGGIVSIITNIIGLFLARGGFVEAYAGGGSPGLDTGRSGLIRGPGTGTSDSIMGRLPVGSFIMRAAAVRKLGGDYLSSLSQSAAPLRASADSVLARVSSGEWYFDPGQVGHIGRGFLEHLNALGDPPQIAASPLAFAKGGSVDHITGGPSSAPASTANGQRGGDVRIINVVDPSMAKNYLESSSGEKVIMNILSRNATVVQQIARAR